MRKKKETKFKVIIADDLDDEVLKAEKYIKFIQYLAENFNIKAMKEYSIKNSVKKS